MAVARVGAASLELGDPTATFDLDNAGGVFELVEVRRDLLVAQREHVGRPEFVKC
jgi:hypothetical protein